MIQINTPVVEDAIRSLKVGDEVEISGTLFTGRDAVHKYLHEGGTLPRGVDFRGTRQSLVGRQDSLAFEFRCQLSW